jgi:Cys-tRNA(Pro) deacylase
MAQATRATRMLDAAGVAYVLHAYDYDPSVDSIGQAAAAALGVEAGQVFKTLMVLADGKPACVIAPSDSEVAMKKAAAALGAKHAEMMKPADAERIAGYRIGGISPLAKRAACRWRWTRRRCCGTAFSSMPGSAGCNCASIRRMRRWCWRRGGRYSRLESCPALVLTSSRLLPSISAPYRCPRGRPALSSQEQGAHHGS